MKYSVHRLREAISMLAEVPADGNMKGYRRAIRTLAGSSSESIRTLTGSSSESIRIPDMRESVVEIFIRNIYEELTISDKTRHQILDWGSISLTLLEDPELLSGETKYLHVITEGSSPYQPQNLEPGPRLECFKRRPNAVPPQPSAPAVLSLGKGIYSFRSRLFTATPPPTPPPTPIPPMDPLALSRQFMLMPPRTLR